MLAMVCVVQIGSMTRTSACITAFSPFSCAIAENGKASAASDAQTPANIRNIIESPLKLPDPMHKLCKAEANVIPSVALCHPERSEGSFRQQERSLAALG